jgi:IS30 family transposase
MKKFNINVTQGDIVRAIRNTKYSPLQIAASRAIGRDIDTIDVNRDKIYCWIYDDSDYISYNYDTKDISTISDFIDCWEDYKEYNDEFKESPFNFTVEEKR